MIEIRIEHYDEPRTGRCYFCWCRLDDPETVRAVVYEDGEPVGGYACFDCLTLPEAELRGVMRDTAAHLADLSSDIRSASRGPIARPPADVLHALAATVGTADSVERFIVAHTPCLLADAGALLVRVVDHAQAVGICGRCGSTFALNLREYEDVIEAERAMMRRIGYAHAGLFSDAPDVSVAAHECVARIRRVLFDAIREGMDGQE